MICAYLAAELAGLTLTPRGERVVAYGYCALVLATSVLVSTLDAR